MSFLIPFSISFLAGISTVLGSIPIFFKWQRENINKFITFALSFSLTIMIAISITELIPASSFAILTNFKLFKGVLLSLSAFIIGIITIYFINKKIEKGSSKDYDLYRVGILSMFALMLHNFPEGIVTFLSSYQNINLGLKISLAIMLHNIPEGISIAVPLYYATGDKKKSIKATLLSGISEPLGALFAFIFLRRFITDIMISFILIFVAGIMITLAIHELLPKALKYHQDTYVFLGAFAGIILTIINHFFL